MKLITYSDFELVELRTGTVTNVQGFPEAHNPSYKVWVDFWEEIGIKKTSAQITELYSKEELVGKQVVWVINLPPKQIANFTSEFLLTGFHTDEGVVLTSIDKEVKDGTKLL